MLFFTSSSLLNRGSLNWGSTIISVKKILTCFNIFYFKSFSKSFRYAPLCTDHHIVNGLVPKVISHGSGRPRLPTSFDVKRLSVQDNEASWKWNVSQDYDQHVTSVGHRKKSESGGTEMKLKTSCTPGKCSVHWAIRNYWEQVILLRSQSSFCFL